MPERVREKLQIAVLTVLCSLSGSVWGKPPTPPQRMTLDAVTAAALRGPRSRAARHATRAMQGRVQEANGARFPTVTLTGLLAPSPEIKCLPSIDTCTSTNTKDITLQFKGVFGRVQATAIQPLWTFGKLDAARTAAQLATTATRHQENALAGDIALEAAQAYYGVKLARELTWMLEDGQEQVQKALVRLEKRLKRGSPDVTLQDKLRVKTMQAEISARLEEAREARAIALAGLRALVGNNNAEPDEDALEAVTFQLANDAKDYVARAHNKRPELQAVNNAALALASLAEFERARYFPDLVLVANASYARAQGVDDPPSAFANDPFNGTSAGLGLVLRWQLDPFMQAGRVARARAQSDQTRELALAAKKGIEFEVETAHAMAKHAGARLAASRTGEKHARAWVASVLQADAIGTADSKDLADAYVAYFGAHSRLLTSHFQWNVAVVRLHRAIGEFTAVR